MSATRPTRPQWGDVSRDGMIGMALHQGLFDRDGRVLEKVNRLVESGLAALDAGSETRAAIAFVKALGLLEVREPAARFEEFAKAFSAVGDGLLRVGRLESAQAVTLEPDDVDGYARILALSPEDAELWVRKGDAHRRRNEPDEAQSAFDRALRVDPDRKDALEGKALTYLAVDEPQRALRCLDRVIQIDPYDSDAWRLRGDVLAAAKRNDEALRSYDEAIRQRDADANAWYGRAEVLRRIGRSVDAVYAYDRAVELSPKSVKPHTGRLEALRNLARWDEVVQEAGKIVALDPAHAGALYAKAHAFLQ